MTTEHKSDFIFSLADKYGIPIDNKKNVEILDESYDNFRKEYIELARTRDFTLISHLTSKPKIFRTFLPWYPNVFDTVFQLQWYYDELVIYDPIIFEILHFKTGQKEEDKNRLRSIISFLSNYRDSISSGFLLFGSYDSLFDNSQNKIIPDFKKLIALPEVRDELDKLVHVSKMEKSNGREIVDYTIRAYYRGKHSFSPIIKKPDNPIPNADGTYTWTVDFIGSHYTPMTVKDVKSVGAYEQVFGNLEKEYSAEILETLNYLSLGTSLNTPILFNRKIDELVINNLSGNDKMVNQSKANNYYNLFLPFVFGIPANRLLDIRNNMPNAFQDFRNTMFEIIFDLKQNNFEPEILELKIQQRVNPILRKLEVEMKNSLTKARILALGIPIVSGLGAWGFWQIGLDITKVTGLLFGGVSVPAELKILTDRLTEKNTLSTNPFYYLWKVSQSR